MLRVIISFCLCYCSYCLFSQVSDSETNSDSLSIENIVISASRASTDDPLTFSNVSKEQIEEIYVGQDPVVLIQELSPSIVSYSDGGTGIGNYSQFRMRGIDQSRVNITLNGVPLNDMVDHGTFFSNFSDFGNSIESVQIQRGVAASNRGVASFAGAVNFESINLFGGKPSAEAQLTVGSFGTLRTAAELSTGRMDNNLGFYGRFTRTGTDGYKFNSGSDSYSLFFSGGRTGGKDILKLTAFSGKTQNGQSYLHVPIETIREEPRTNFNNLNDVDDFEQHMVQLLYAKSINSGTSYSLTTYYNGAGGVFPFTFDGSQFMFGLTNDHYGIMANLLHEDQGNSWNVGVHAYIFDRTNFEYISPFVREPYARDFTDKTEMSAFIKYNRQMNSLNAFANVELRLLSMSINGDPVFDLDRNIENNWTFLNAVVGLNYAINPLSSIYFSYGRSGREPTRSDILNGVSKEEHVNDFELGWRYKNGPWKVKTNAFYMSFEDEITQIGALQERSYIEIRQNVGSSRRTGFELQMACTFNDHLSTLINAAYMNTNIKEYNNGLEVLTDVDHIFAPDFIIQPVFKYNFTNNAFLRLSGRYLSESFTELSNNSEFVLPAHFIANVQLNFNLVDNLKASFVLNNVLNKLYFTEGAPIDLDFDGLVESIGYRAQPPRHFYIMVRYRI